jgi:hypothetical protein
MKNLIQKIANEDDLFTNLFPRISRAEIRELGELGFMIQIEHTYGASPGPIAVYAVHLDEAKKLAKKLLKEAS